MAFASFPCAREERLNGSLGRKRHERRRVVTPLCRSCALLSLRIRSLLIPLNSGERFLVAFACPRRHKVSSITHISYCFHLCVAVGAPYTPPPPPRLLCVRQQISSEDLVEEAQDVANSFVLSPAMPFSESAVEETLKRLAGGAGPDTFSGLQVRSRP